MRTLASVAASLIAVSAAALAAPITWEQTVAINSSADLITEGAFSHARNFTADGLPAVIIPPSGEPIFFEPFRPETATTPTTNFFSFDGQTTGDPELDLVLNSHAFGLQWDFLIDGLTPGNAYLVQIIAGGDNRPPPFADFTQRAGDAEPLESISDDIRRGDPGSAIGRFIADGSTQRIRAHEGIIFPQLPAFSGYVLRELQPPLPPDDIALSTDRIDTETTAGTLLGILSANDPNADDTHQFDIVGLINFPDGNLFSIANDNQLIAAVDLGPPGTTYQISLRAADQGHLSHTEAFQLTVLPPPPITSVSYQPDALTLTAPHVPGRRMALLYSPDLTPGSWLSLGNFSQNGDEMTFTDPDTFRLARPRGFYRTFLRPVTP